MVKSRRPIRDPAMATILVVDDEAAMVASMRFFLEKEGYRVLTATTGAAALDVAAREHPDLVILDVMLPDLDGLEVTRRLRRDTPVPIIMVSARGEEIDKVVGLEVGADDYLAKPFGPREFIARVRAALRRGRGGRRLELPRKEFELLRVLAEHAGEVVPRRVLLETVWGADFFGEEKTLDVHISRLRQRLEEDPSAPALIHTVRGVGYRLASFVP